MRNADELDALIRLLDDPDEEIYRQIFDKLVSFGKDLIPSLELYWEQVEEEIVRDRIEAVIHQIQLGEILVELKDWANKSNPSLFDGAVIIAQHRFTEIDIDKTRLLLEECRKKVWLEMSYNLTHIEQIRVFNQVFYQVLGFKGSTGSKSELEIAYLHQALEHRTGSIFTLGLLYLHLAQVMDMEVVAVEVPQTFLLANLNSLTESILFYINPLMKGRILSGDEVTSELKKIGIEVTEKFEQALSNQEIIISYLKYLEQIYLNRKMNYQVLDIQKMIETIEDSI